MQRTVGEIVKDYEARGELVPVPAPIIMRPPMMRPPMGGVNPSMNPMAPGAVPGQVPMMGYRAPMGQIPPQMMPQPLGAPPLWARPPHHR